MASAVEWIAERRIAQAMADGDFDDLPGRGRPLRLPEDGLLDPTWRAAFTILKNAGYVPEWVELRRAISESIARARVEADGGRVALSPQRLAEINRRIVRLNRIVPHPSLQMAPFLMPLREQG